MLDRWVKRAFESADETRPVRRPQRHRPAPAAARRHVQPPALRLVLRGGGRPRRVRRDHAADGALRQRVRRPVRAPDAPTSSIRPRWPRLDWEELAERYGYEPASFETHVPPAPHPTFDSWREATQRYQATLLRHQIETMRRLKYQPTGGFTLMMLNDAAPSISWSLLDHDRQPKLAHQAVVDACRPVIVIADQLPDLLQTGDALALDVHVVNDLRRAARRRRLHGHPALAGWQPRVALAGRRRGRLRGPRRHRPLRRPRGARRAVARPHHRARRRHRHQSLRRAPSCRPS